MGLIKRPKPHKTVYDLRAQDVHRTYDKMCDRICEIFALDVHVQTTISGSSQINCTQLLFIACSFFFFGQDVVPNIFADAQFGAHRFGFANTDFSAFVQKFLNKSIICGFFWDMFHNGKLIYYSGCKQQVLSCLLRLQV